MDRWDETPLGTSWLSGEGRSRPRILVAEGESIVALDIGMILRSAGPVETAFAHSGEEAVEKAEEFRPDLLLLDASLKGRVSGLQAAEVILRRFGIPVLFMVTSKNNHFTSGLPGPRAPFRYLVKPFEHDELLEAVRASLEGLQP